MLYLFNVGSANSHRDCLCTSQKCWRNNWVSVNPFGLSALLCWVQCLNGQKQLVWSTVVQSYRRCCKCCHLALLSAFSCHCSLIFPVVVNIFNRRIMVGRMINNNKSDDDGCFWLLFVAFQCWTLFTMRNRESEIQKRFIPNETKHLLP